MRWIGLCGRAGAGKDYLADRLIESDLYLTKVSFAEGLRSEIEEVLQTDIPVLWDKPTLPDVRRLLQWWGTDLRRAENPNHWIDRAESRAKRLVESGLTPIFTDVRFPNEAEMIVRNGGFIVRVYAPSMVRKERLGELPPEHASETAMDNYPVSMSLPSIRDTELYRRYIQRILVTADAGRLG